MVEKFLNLTNVLNLNDVASLAMITSLLVQGLKQIVPKKFPTKILTVIVGLIVSLSASLLYYGFTFKVLIVAIFMGLIVSFVSIYGFDTFKDIWNRLKSINNSGGGQ